MFNLQPGTGVGFSGSREMALGLGGSVAVVEEETGATVGIQAPGVYWDEGEEELIMAVIMAFLEIEG